MTPTPPYTSGASFYLPQFPYLLPAREHPLSEQICEASNTWVRTNMAFAMADEAEMDRLIEERAALWTCFVLPTAHGDRLLDLCNYTEFLSVFDNAMVDRTKIGEDADAAEELFARVANILADTAVGPDFEWGRVLQELWRGMRARFPERQWDRLMAEVQRFLGGCVSEIASRSQKLVFDYDDYIALRRDSVGMGMYFVLGEYGLGIDLTDTLAESKELRELVDLALEHIMLTNDMFSFRAECSMDDYVNALAVLQINEGLDLQSAVDRLFTVIEARRTDFMAARRSLELGPLGTDPDVRAYLDALWHMMAGNLHWSYITSRYHGVGHVWNCVRSGVLTLHPDRTEFHDAPYWSLSR